MLTTADQDVHRNVQCSGWYVTDTRTAVCPWLHLQRVEKTDKFRFHHFLASFALLSNCINHKYYQQDWKEDGRHDAKHPKHPPFKRHWRRIRPAPITAFGNCSLTWHFVDLKISWWISLIFSTSWSTASKPAYWLTILFLTSHVGAAEYNSNAYHTSTMLMLQSTYTFFRHFRI